MKCWNTQKNITHPGHRSMVPKTLRRRSERLNGYKGYKVTKEEASLPL
jgi:hypothetical protein